MTIARANNSILKVISGGGGGGAYILDEVPTDDFGVDGEYAIVMQHLVAGDNGTIIPPQSDDTNCISCYENGIYKVFDNDASTYITFYKAEDPKGSIPAYLGYDFGENDKKKIVSVSILNKSTYYTNYLGIVFIQASDDKENWVTLSCGKLPNTVSSNWYTLTFENDSYYRYYRVCFYSSYNIYELNVYEIHMNDSVTINTGKKQPLALKKRCGLWVPLDAHDTMAPYAESVRSLYIPNGSVYTQNIGYPIFVSRGQTYTTDCKFEAEWDMDSSLTLPYNNNSQSYSILGLASYYTSNPLVSVLLGLTGYDSGTGTYNQVTITAATRGGYFNYTMTIADFRNLKRLKVVIQGANVAMYFDDTLVTGTITGYMSVNYTNTYNYILGQNPSGLSAQLGLKEFKCTYSNGGRVIFDFIPAKNTINGQFGFIEKVSNVFFGVNTVPQEFPIIN